MNESLERLASFKRNLRLEDLLATISASLKEAGRPAKKSVEQPTLFIVGAPRTGSTYCMQWLAASGAFTYPSNFIARFWTAPFLGAVVQEMLVNPDFDFRGEFADIRPNAVTPSSEVGKTAGMLSPSEFWFFWREHFPGDGDLGLDLSKAGEDQFATFRDEIVRFADVRNRPAAMKAKIINHQIEAFASGVPKALFLFMDRDPVDVAWSLLESRRRIYGDDSRWWSFKTPDYEFLQALDPLKQVVGQIQSIRRDVQRALSHLPSNRWLRVDYSDLCKDPNGEYSRVVDLFNAHGVELQGRNMMPSVTPVTGKAPAAESARIRQALERL